MKLLLFILVFIPVFGFGQWSEDSDVAPDDGFAEEFPREFSRSSRSLLERSGIFTIPQLEAIISHRKQFGPFLTRYELQVIPGITPSQLDQIDLFFTFREALLTASDIEAGKDKSSGLVLFQSTLRKDKGPRYRMRMEIRRKDWFIGLRMDQDYEERWRWEPGKSIWGVDHISGTVQWRNHGWIESITLGEFRIQAGEGLVHSGRFFLGKGSQPPLPAASVSVLGRPSYDENLRRKGMAIQLNLSQWKTIVYASKGREDAHLYSDGSFRSISTSGIHSTDSDRKKHNRLDHISYGLVSEREFNGGSVGFSINTNIFSAPYLPAREYQSALPRGRTMRQASIFGKWNWKNAVFWSEHALSFNIQRASLLGAGIAIGRYLSVFGVIRDYQQGYLSFFGRGFAESSSGQRNEQGLYLGIGWKRKKKFKVYGYVDLYRFPGSSFRHISNLKGLDVRFWGERTFNNWQIRTLSKWEGRNQSPGKPEQMSQVFKQQFYGVRTSGNGSLILRAHMNIRKEESLLYGKLLSIERRWKVKNLQWSIAATVFKLMDFIHENLYMKRMFGALFHYLRISVQELAGSFI